MNKDGGPAFPVVIDDVRDFTTYQDYGLIGMTLRDWFAGQVLAGVLADSKANPSTFDKLARFAYDASDAMLAERDKP